MGLDMYLSGKKIYGGHWGSKRKEDGLPVEKVVLALGYWRKNWSLHDFIVQEYGSDSHSDGSDPIELTAAQITEIIEAVQTDRLDPEDGWSPEEWEQQKQETIDMLGKALMWISFDTDPLECKPQWKSFEYQASW